MSISDEVLQAMRTTNARFCDEVIAAKNFSAADGVYTTDAKVLPPGVPMVEGREAIQHFWETAVEGLGITGAALRTVTAEMAGESAVEIGEATLDLKAGGPVVAKYVVHWKQQNGQWLWDKDIWNLNA
jgi:ketosteroid isomerase-like protein